VALGCPAITSLEECTTLHRSSVNIRSEAGVGGQAPRTVASKAWERGALRTSAMASSLVHMLPDEGKSLAAGLRLVFIGLV
jgi:hypothetical protein